MKVQNQTQIPAETVTMEGAHQCLVRWLIGERDAAPNFAMRQFTIEPAGYTPKHTHPYEHEVYILAGEGTVLDGDTPRKLTSGDVVYIRPDEVHQFRNTGSEPLTFLCLIPNAAAGKPVTVVP